MLRPPPSRLLRALRRLGPGPDPGGVSDAELLGRFAEARDEAAFEELLRRHAGMVLRVCRRHLGSADAEDAFQAVFLVLARDAARIGRRAALAGWLFRVAFNVSRKLMGQNARRRTLPVRDADAPAGPDPGRDELRAIVEAEVDALPERLRGAVVLCYLEGRSNSEAAALLGCPKGTIDSRLAAARKRLHARLLRRGVALAGAAALESLWSAEGVAAAPGLVRRTLEAVSLFARTGSAAGAVTRHVLTLVAGVSTTMSTYRLALVFAAAVLLATLGGAGLTVFHAKAEGDPPAAAAKDKPPEKAKPPAKPAEPPGPRPEKAEITNESVQAMLRRPLGVDRPPDAMKFRDFLEFLQDRFEVPIRIDLAAFARHGKPGAVALYDQQVLLPVVRGMTLADALRDALAQLGDPVAEGQPMNPTFRVRNGQILIVPAFVPSVSSVGGPAPGGSAVADSTLPANLLLEQQEGEPVSLAVEEKPFAEVLRELRQTTGANIVLDAREKDKARMAVSATLNDVRLMAALRVLGDMCDLQPVALNNVFYVTSKENAEKLQKEIDRRRYGDPPQFGGGLGHGTLGAPGFGLGGLGGLGGGIGGGGIGVPGPAAPAAPAGNPAPTKPADKVKPEK